MVVAVVALASLGLGQMALAAVLVAAELAQEEVAALAVLLALVGPTLMVELVGHMVAAVGRGDGNIQ